MESFWRPSKQELIHRHHFQTREQARQVIFDFIEASYARRLAVVSTIADVCKNGLPLELSSESCDIRDHAFLQRQYSTFYQFALPSKCQGAFGHSASQILSVDPFGI
jgi:hypothetical protein